MDNVQQHKNKGLKPQREYSYIVMVSLVYATIMLISSTIFADMEHLQSFIMPLIAMLFAPLFLFH